MGTRTAPAIALLIRGLSTGLVAAWLSGCGDCAPVGRPAFSITVLDHETGAAAASEATVYVFRRPDFTLVDAALALDTLRILAAWGGQEGRFDVLLEKSGYWPWSAQNISVGSDASCSTVTVNLTARIRRRVT